MVEAPGEEEASVEAVVGVGLEVLAEDRLAAAARAEAGEMRERRGVKIREPQAG